MITPEDLHQRRFAGSVLTDEHVDGAPPNLKVDVAQRRRSRKDLSDPFRFQNHVRLGRERRFAHGGAPFATSIEIGVTRIFADADPSVAAP